MKDRLKKGFWNVLTVIAIIVLASMIISKAVTGWSSVFSYRVFYIMSESMEPVIAENGLVIGRVLSDDEKPQVGNIYADKRDGILGQEIVIHRLIAITEDGRYQFQGDNNELSDEMLVEREDIGYEIIGH